MGLEIAETLLRDYSAMDAPEHAFAINFGALVHHLKEMDDETPIKFVVMTGIGSPKPLSTLNLTVGGLRKINRVLEAFQ